MPHIHLCNIVCRALLTLSFASVANDPDYLPSVNTTNYLDSSTHDASFELMTRSFNTALQIYDPYPVYTLFHCINENLDADQLAALAQDNDLDDVDEQSTDMDTRLIVEVPTLVTSSLYTIMHPQVIPSPSLSTYVITEDIWSTIGNTSSSELLVDLPAGGSSTSVKSITATIHLHARTYMATIVRATRFHLDHHRLLLLCRSKTAHVYDMPPAQSVMHAVVRVHWPTMKLAARGIRPLLVVPRQLASFVRTVASSVDNVSVIAVHKLLYGVVTFAILVSATRAVRCIAPICVLKAKRKVRTFASTTSRFPACILVSLRVTLSSMTSGTSRVKDLLSGTRAYLKEYDSLQRMVRGSGSFNVFNGRVSAPLSIEKLVIDCPSATAPTLSVVLPIDGKPLPNYSGGDFKSEYIVPALFTDKDNELNDPMSVSLPAKADYCSVLVASEVPSPLDEDMSQAQSPSLFPANPGYIERGEANIVTTSNELWTTLLEYYTYVQAMTWSLGNTPSGRLLKTFYRLLMQTVLVPAMNVYRVLPGCLHQVGGHALSRLKLLWRYALKGKVVFINFPPNRIEAAVLKRIVSIIQYALLSVENTPSGRLIKAVYSLTMPPVMAFANEVCRVTTNCLRKFSSRALHHSSISFRRIQDVFQKPLSLLHSSATTACSRLYAAPSLVVSRSNHWKNALHARYMHELQHDSLRPNFRSSPRTSISSRVFAILLLDSLNLLWTGTTVHELTPPSTCKVPSEPIDPVLVPLPVADEHELDIDPALVPLPVDADDNIEFDATNVLLAPNADNYVHVDPTPINYPVDTNNDTEIKATCVHFPPDLEEGTESGPSHVQEPALAMNGTAWLRGDSPSMFTSGEGIVEGGRIELNLATLDALYPVTSLDDLRAPSTVQHAFDSHAVDKHMHLTVETAHIRLLTVELDLDPAEIQLPDNADLGISLESSCIALPVDADERMELDPLTVPLSTNCDNGLEVSSSGADNYSSTLALGPVILASDKCEEVGLDMMGNTLEDTMTVTLSDLNSTPSYEAAASDDALDPAVVPLPLDIDSGSLLDVLQLRLDAGGDTGVGNGTTGFGHDMALVRKAGDDDQRNMVTAPSFYIDEAVGRYTADGAASQGAPNGKRFAISLYEPAQPVEPMDRLEADFASSSMGATVRDEVKQAGTSNAIDPTMIPLPLDADDGTDVDTCQAPSDMYEHIVVENSAEQLREDADVEFQSTHLAPRGNETAGFGPPLFEDGDTVADIVTKPGVSEWFGQDSLERDELAQLVETVEDPDGNSAFDSGVATVGSHFEQGIRFDGIVLASATSDVMGGDNAKQAGIGIKEADSSWLSDEVTFVSFSDGSEEGCPDMAFENLEMHSTVKWEVEPIPIRTDVLDICTRDETDLFDDCMSQPVVRIAEGNCYRRLRSGVNESFMNRVSAQDDSALVTTTKTDLLHESWTKVSTYVVKLGSRIRLRSGEASHSTRTDTETTAGVLEPGPVFNWADDVEASADGVSVPLNRRQRKAEKKRLAMLAAGMSMPTNSGTDVAPLSTVADDVGASVNGTGIPLNRRQRKAERKRLAMLAAGIPYRRNGWGRPNAVDDTIQAGSNSLQRPPGTAPFGDRNPQNTHADPPVSRGRGFNGQETPQNSHAGPSRVFMAQGRGQGQISQDWRQRPNEHQEIHLHRRRQHQQVPFPRRRQHHSVSHAPFAGDSSPRPGYRARRQHQPRPANELLQTTGVHQSNATQQSLPSGDVLGESASVSLPSPRPTRAQGSCDIPGTDAAATAQASRRRNNSGSNQDSGSQPAAVRSSTLRRANHAETPGRDDSGPSFSGPTARMPNVWAPPWNNARRPPSMFWSITRPQAAATPQQ